MALGFPIANLQTLEETNYLQDELIHAYDRVDLEEVWGALCHRPAESE